MEYQEVERNQHASWRWECIHSWMDHILCLLDSYLKLMLKRDEGLVDTHLWFFGLGKHYI